MMRNTYQVKLEELSQELPPKNQNPLTSGKLLLICDGSGQIVFAHGNARIFNASIGEIMHRRFFELGFTQYSLLKMAEQAKGGILQPPRSHRSITLEVAVKITERISRTIFQSSKTHFLKKIHANCSLTLVKFGTDLIKYGLCQVKRKPLTLLDWDGEGQFLTIVELTPVQGGDFKTTFEDYLHTSRFLPTRQLKNN